MTTEPTNEMKDWEHIIQRILIALLLMAIIAGTLWKLNKIEPVKYAPITGTNDQYGDRDGK